MQNPPAALLALPACLRRPPAWFARTAGEARVRRAAFAAGARAVLPANVATGTWGLVTGLAMVQAGMSPAQAVGMTLTVFAGSAQLAALPLIVAQAPAWVIVVTALVVNLRFVIFSAGLHPYFRALPPRRRLLLGYLTGDVSFAIFVARQAARERDGARRPGSAFPRSLAGREAFFLGMAVPTWVGWQVASMAGIVLAGRIPTSWGLSFAGILALIALTLPMIVGLPATAGAVVAAIVGVVAAHWPLKLGLLAAMVVGMTVAMAADALIRPATRPADGAGR